MNNINPDEQKNVICHCSGTTTRQIMELVDGGVDNLERLSRITGASSGCGACETELLDLLAECRLA